MQIISCVCIVTPPLGKVLLTQFMWKKCGKNKKNMEEVQTDETFSFNHTVVPNNRHMEAVIWVFSSQFYLL
jgi:hypothetical protein